jgi:hypothetical protein
MATATLPQSPAAIMDLWSVGNNSTPRAQSPEGIEVSKITSLARRHWFDRGERVIHGITHDLQSYLPVPPRRVTHAQVRYIDHGRGQPLPLEWEWDD